MGGLRVGAGWMGGLGYSASVLIDFSNGLMMSEF